MIEPIKSLRLMGDRQREQPDVENSLITIPEVRTFGRTISVLHKGFEFVPVLYSRCKPTYSSVRVQR